MFHPVLLSGDSISATGFVMRMSSPVALKSARFTIRISGPINSALYAPDLGLFSPLRRTQPYQARCRPDGYDEFFDFGNSPDGPAAAANAAVARNLLHRSPAMTWKNCGVSLLLVELRKL